MSSTAAYMHFLWAGIAKHGQTGGILPSQRFLISKMIAPVPEDFTGRIIELGAGSGALTLRLALRCPKAKIVACEINPTLARDNRCHLNEAGINGQVKVVAAPAQQVLSEMIGNGREKAGFIISGIPLANLGKEKTLALINAVSEALDEGGMYIQFQHSLLDQKRIQSKFPRMRAVQAFLNFPPAFVYYAPK